VPAWCSSTVASLISVADVGFVASWMLPATCFPLTAEAVVGEEVAD
jgi:hypothetical protein